MLRRYEDIPNLKSDDDYHDSIQLHIEKTHYLKELLMPTINP